MGKSLSRFISLTPRCIYICICNIYVPPLDSKVLSSSNIDLYNQLEQDIINYHELRKVYVSGDLNAERLRLPRILNMISISTKT